MDKIKGFMTSTKSKITNLLSKAKTSASTNPPLPNVMPTPVPMLPPSVSNTSPNSNTTNPNSTTTKLSLPTSMSISKLKSTIMDKIEYSPGTALSILIIFVFLVFLVYKVIRKRQKAPSDNIKNPTTIDLDLKKYQSDNMRIIHEDNPTIVEIHNFLSPEECEHLIQLATTNFKTKPESRFKRSGVVAKDGTTTEDPVRTSSSASFTKSETPIIKGIEDRVSNLLHLPKSHIEALQIVKYTPGEKYDAHNDWFHHDGMKNQRFITILCYLNDNFEGGHTDFVNLDLSIKPKRGNAIMWRNCQNNDIKSCFQDAKHRGSPPTKGTKYALNIWTRFQPYS